MYLVRGRLGTAGSARGPVARPARPELTCGPPGTPGTPGRLCGPPAAEPRSQSQPGRLPAQHPGLAWRGSRPPAHDSDGAVMTRTVFFQPDPRADQGLKRSLSRAMIASSRPSAQAWPVASPQAPAVPAGDILRPPADVHRRARTARARPAWSASSSDHRMAAGQWCAGISQVHETALSTGPPPCAADGCRGRGRALRSPRDLAHTTCAPALAPATCAPALAPAISTALAPANSRVDCSRRCDIAHRACVRTRLWESRKIRRGGLFLWKC
jgi:hypothetical protein